MFPRNRTRMAGIVGMFGALLFFIGLLIEYHFGLFPPGSGRLYVINQIMFSVAMICILAMLLVMRSMQVGGSGRFGRITFTLFPIGWATLVSGSILNLISGSNDSSLIPLGALITMIFGLLAGIAVAISKQWTGWTRFALLPQGSTYFLLVIGVIIANIEPNLLTESLWMATWFLVGLSVYVHGKVVADSSLAF